MAREPALVAELLAILLWLTGMANVAVRWFIQDRLLESAHRERYGRFQTRWRLVSDTLRNPRSAPSVLRHDLIERYRARFEPVDDQDIERRRAKSWMAFGAYAAAVFIGAPTSFAVVAVIRTVLPGTIAFWLVLADAVLLACWIREGSGALQAGSRRPAAIAGSVVGGVLCLLSGGLAIYVSVVVGTAK